MNRIVINIIFLLLSILSVSASACSVCFKPEGNETTAQSIRFGVLFLLAILLFVLGAFVSFFLNIRKRAKLISDSQ